MKSELRNMVPSSLWKVVAHAKYAVLDALDIVRGRRDPLVPPRGRIFIGSGDFRKTGEEFLRYFRALCNLSPNETVLDVGSGIGRMAVALTGYLSSDGHYEGFDIVRSGVAWCQQNITPRFPNFSFSHADVHNREYTPQGRFKASEYRFPYPDRAFDFVFLTSVFTHMRPGEVDHYLREIRRVLKPTGRCMITWLLLNEQSLHFIREGKASLQLIHPIQIAGLPVDCRVANRSVPEEAIGYPEADVLTMYSKAGFVVDSVHYGSWPGRARFLSYQDVVIAH